MSNLRHGLVWFPYVMMILSLCVHACHPNLGIYNQLQIFEWDGMHYSCFTIPQWNDAKLQNYLLLWNGKAHSPIDDSPHPCICHPHTICNYRLNFQRVSTMSLTMKQHDLPYAFVSIFLWKTSQANSRGDLAPLFGSCRIDFSCWLWIRQSSYFAILKNSGACWG